MTTAKLWAKSVFFWFPLLILVACGSEDEPTRQAGPARVASDTLVRTEGVLGAVTAERIAGWAWDMDKPDESISVDIYDGTTLLATIPADRFRQGLLDKKKGNGRHGFAYKVPATLRDGQPHTIHVKISGAEKELSRSPKAHTFTSPNPG